MKITVSNHNADTLQTECLVLFTATSEKLTPGQSAAGKQDFLSDILSRGDLENKPGSSLLLPYIPESSAQRVLVVATGPKKANRKTTQKIISSVVSSLAKAKIKEAAICLDDLFAATDLDHQWITSQLAQNFLTQTYTFEQFKTKSKKDNAPKFEAITILTQDADKIETSQTASDQGLSIAAGINTARELGNLPGNVCTPQYLADQATALAQDNSNLTTEILDEPAMEKLGMGAFLSVSKGSVNKGCMIAMNYQAGPKEQAPYVLVGKGITFDSGGICIKPGPSMDEMKFDMCGAATVMGVMHAITALKLPINVIGMIAAAENMPAGNASKPGDIVTSMSGQTIEIINTDAEGRLVLCDALTYAERFKPAAVVDIATLTGACIIALGHHISGMVSNNDELANNLKLAGEKSLDEVWQLPMGEEYDKQLESPCADLQNIGGRAAGTITAGCFLGQFTNAYPWAHIDIAGTAWKTGKDKAATGRPVAMLTQYLATIAENSQS